MIKGKFSENIKIRTNCKDTSDALQKKEKKNNNKQKSLTDMKDAPLKFDLQALTKDPVTIQT